MLVCFRIAVIHSKRVVVHSVSYGFIPLHKIVVPMGWKDYFIHRKLQKTLKIVKVILVMRRTAMRSFFLANIAPNCLIIVVI